MTERELAKQAADWINQTPLDVYPRVQCHRSLTPERWYVTVYEHKNFFHGGYDTDAKLIERARAMGWTPEGTTDEPARTPMFPSCEETEV